MQQQVTIRWLSKGPGQEPQQVTGIIVLEVVKNADKKASQKWLIKTVYSEFNSGTSSSLDSCSATHSRNQD